MSGVADSEKLLGSFASSGLARRRGLAWFQGYGIYLTDTRLIVIHVKAPRALDWHPGAGSLLGSFSTKVAPFIDPSPQTMVALEKGEIEFESSVEQIVSVELRRPGKWFHKGSVRIRLSSGKAFSLGIMEETEAYGEEAYEALARLFRASLPEKVKIA